MAAPVLHLYAPKAFTNRLIARVYESGMEPDTIPDYNNPNTLYYRYRLYYDDTGTEGRVPKSSPMLNNYAYGGYVDPDYGWVYPTLTASTSSTSAWGGWLEDGTLYVFERRGPAQVGTHVLTVGETKNTGMAGWGTAMLGTYDTGAFVPFPPGQYEIPFYTPNDVLYKTYILTMSDTNPPTLEEYVPVNYQTLELTGLHTASAHLQEVGVSNSIQLSIRSYSDLLYNIDPAQLALIPLTETSSINIGDVKLPGRLPLVVRRYNIDSIAGTYIDQFEITHNKYDTWDEHALDMVMGGKSKQTLYPVNVKSAIYVQSWSGANVNDWGIVNRAVIKLPILAESAYTFPVFYRSRRVSMIWQMFSVFKFIQDVTRTRSISGDWIADSIFEWVYKYLFLKRRIYINIEPFAVLELLFTLWKEGNPAIRVEPIKWYKKRLDAGDIIIKENPWI